MRIGRPQQLKPSRSDQEQNPFSECARTVDGSGNAKAKAKAKASPLARSFLDSTRDILRRGFRVKAVRTSPRFIIAEWFLSSHELIRAVRIMGRRSTGCPVHTMKLALCLVFLFQLQFSSSVIGKLTLPSWFWHAIFFIIELNPSSADNSSAISAFEHFFWSY